MPTKKSPTSAAKPDQEPPEEQSKRSMAVEGTQSRPSDLTAEEMAAASQMASGASAPTLQPPVAAAGGFTGTWQSSKTITALWSINQNRNVWAFVAGVGWVKLLDSSDNIIMQLTMLTANAKETGGQVSYRTEADGMMHEIYVW